jgi:hypothetical protein
MAAPYTVVNLGHMAGDNVDSFVKSVQATTDLPNGALVAITGVVSGQKSVFSVAAATDVTAQEVLLVKSPEIIEVNGLRVDLTDPTQFFNPANRPATAFHLKVGDTLTATDDWFTGTSTLNQYIIPANGTTVPAAAATLAGGTVVAFQVIEKTTIAVGSTRKNATRVMVVKSR